MKIGQHISKLWQMMMLAIFKNTVYTQVYKLKGLGDAAPWVGQSHFSG